MQLPSEFQAQQQELQRKKMLADMLITQGMQQPQGQMVSGHYVGQGILGNLLPVAKALAGKKFQSQADQGQVELQQNYQTSLAKAMQDYQTKAQANPMEAARGAAMSEYDPVKQVAKADYERLQKAMTPRTVGGELVQMDPNSQKVTSLYNSNAQYSPIKEIYKDAEGRPLMGQVNEKTGEANVLGGQGKGLTINTASNAWDKELPKQILKRLDESYETNINKVASIRSVDAAMEDLEAGIKSGAGANIEKGVAKVYSWMTGAEVDPSVVNTEAFENNMKRQVAAVAKSLGPAPTDSDREFLKQMSGADVTLEPQAIVRLLKLAKADAYNSIMDHNSLVDKAKGDFGDKAQFYGLEGPKDIGETPESGSIYFDKKLNRYRVTQEVPRQEGIQGVKPLRVESDGTPVLQIRGLSSMSTPELLKGRVKVQMPDGSQIDAPSNVSPYELKAAWELKQLGEQLSNHQTTKPKVLTLSAGDAEWQNQNQELEDAIQERKSVLAKYKAERGGTLDKLGYRAKQIGSSALKGVASIPAAVGDMIAGGAMGEAAPSASAQVQNTGLSPVTKGERRADMITQGATGALAGPGGIARPIVTATTGAGVGLGANLGLEASGEQAIGGVGGGLLAAALLGTPAALKAPKEGMVKDLLQEVPEDALRQAQKTQSDVQASGLGSVNLSQAMQQPSGVDSLVEALATSRHGKKVQQQLNQQPLSASIAADDALATVPGDVRTPQQVANLEQQAATEVIKQTKKKAGQMYGEALPESLELPPQNVQRMISELTSFKKGLAPVEADLVDDVLASIRKPETKAPAGGIVDASGRPMREAPASSPFLTDATQLDKQVRSALDSYGARKLSTPGLDATLGRVAEQIRGIVGNTTESALGPAKQAFSRVMTEEATPLTQSIVGRTAGKGGYDDAIEATRSKLGAALDRGVDPAARGNEILEMQKQLSKVPNGNEAFQDSFKTWLSGKISKATRDQGGRTPEDAAKELTKFFGDPRKPSHASKGMESALVALARSQGKPDDSLVKGIRHVQLFLSSASRRPGNVGDVDKDYMNAMKSEALQGAAGTRAQTTNFIARKFNEWRYADAYKFFDDALTTPEGVDMLVEMSKSNALSPRAAKTLSSFLALQAANSGEAEPLPNKLPE